jgi:glutamine amidotransferase
MELLDSSGMRGALEERVLGDQIPVIGVCVGMQILANRSEEGKGAGLGWIPGTVKHFNSLSPAADLPLPHMGWNDVAPTEDAELFAGLEQNARFYFLHSFCFAPDNDSDAVAIADYGVPFACAVRRGHIWGVQFHPEKSHHFGSMLLKNFAEI